MAIRETGDGLTISLSADWLDYSHKLLVLTLLEMIFHFCMPPRMSQLIHVIFQYLFIPDRIQPLSVHFYYLFLFFFHNLENLPSSSWFFSFQSIRF